MAVGPVTSAYISSKASKKAAEQQAEASRQAIEEQRRQFNTVQGLINPYLEVGQGIGLSNLIKYGEYQPYSEQYPEDFNFSFTPQDMEKYDPGYQFRIDQGLKGINNSAAAKGGLLSGQAAKDINNYAQNQASAEFGPAFGRAFNTQYTTYNTNVENWKNRFNKYLTERNNNFNQELARANIGLGSAQYIGNAGLQTANKVGGYLQDIGNAYGAGSAASGQAWANAGNQISQNNTQAAGATLGLLAAFT